MLDILYGHHGQVVALFCIAHKLVDGIGHPGDELAGLLLLLGESLCCNVIDTFKIEQGLIGIRSLGQSIGEEEDGGAGEYLCNAGAAAGED